MLGNLLGSTEDHEVTEPVGNAELQYMEMTMI